MRSSALCPDAFELNIQVPAKALLFGEYGVLHGGKALACVLPQFFFDVVVKIEKSHFTEMHIESAFVDMGRDEFFRKALLPWRSVLTERCLVIQIKHSFEPALGFGSSSALIAALSYAMFVFTRGAEPKIDNEFLWKKIRASLKHTQGTASGYDVGVQLASILRSSCETQNVVIPQPDRGLQSLISANRFWIFQNKKNSIVPTLKPINLSANVITSMGCMIKTEVYSNTAKVLKGFVKQSKKEKIFFAQSHAKIAEMFLCDPNVNTLHTCMRQSLELAKQQKICLPAEEDHFSEQFEKYNIPFKTMGSGCGDCLWVAASKDSLMNAGLVKSEAIIFSFENFVNECK